MKKFILVSGIVLLVFALIFSSCGNNKSVSPTTPDPTPVPVVMSAVFTADDFEDGDLSSQLGNWVDVNDSTENGQSASSAPVLVSDTIGAGSLKAMKLSGTIKVVSISGGGYSSMGVVPTVPALTTVPTLPTIVMSPTVTPTPAYSGYVGCQTVKTYGADVRNSTKIKFYAKADLPSPASRFSGKVVIENMSGKYCSKVFSYISAYAVYNYDLRNDFVLPQSAAYTIDEVLSSVKKITFIVKMNSYADDIEDVNLFIDDVSFE